MYQRNSESVDHLFKIAFIHLFGKDVGKINTMDRVQRKNAQKTLIPQACIMCLNELESVSDLLLHAKQQEPFGWDSY